MLNKDQTTRTIKAIQQVVEQRLGIDAEIGRVIRVDSILKHLAANKAERYLEQLQSSPESASIWQHLIYELTIGETYFFRDRAQFQLLREYVIPSLVKQMHKTRHIYVWCAGCATGEEAYSLAILLKETIPLDQGWQITLTATDINTQAITAAQKGVYRQWSFRHNTPHILAQYFTPTQNGYVINNDIKQMVRFRQANLISMTPHAWSHIILCRNVMLYFKDEAKRQAEHVLVNSLHGGGWLLLGHAEALHDELNDMKTRVFAGAIAYQKKQVYNTDMPTMTQSMPTYQVPSSDQALTLTGTFPQVNLNDQSKATGYEKAVEAYQDEQHEKAENLLADILTYKPENIHARVMLAAVFANRGANTEAHAHLNTALRKDPLCADAHYLRAMLYLDVAENEKAEQSLKAALYSQQGHPLAAFMLGTLCIQRGDTKRARNLWQQALSETRKLPSGQPISDFNPRTATDFATLIEGQLATNPQ